MDLLGFGEWKRGKKCGQFENIYIVRVEVSEQVYYENDEVKSDSNVKREALDADTDNEDAPPSKRRNICVIFLQLHHHFHQH